MARVRARFSTMLNTQVTRLERPSKAPIPENTASQASCTTSSACARLPMIEAASAGQRTVEAPDQHPKRLLIAAAQSGQEFRLVELGLTHEGCPGALAYCLQEATEFQ